MSQCADMTRFELEDLVLDKWDDIFRGDVVEALEMLLGDDFVKRMMSEITESVTCLPVETLEDFYEIF